MATRSISFILLIFTGLVISCGDPASKGNNGLLADSEDVVLHPGDIFDASKVFQFLKNKSKFLREANSLFLKGINSFRNENNLDSAEYYLATSITREPSGRAYYELGNVYKELDQYDQAISAYKLAEQLDYEPFSNILYNLSAVYSLKEDEENAAKYLEFALQAGFNNLDKLEKDSDMEHLRDNYKYKEAVKKGLLGMSDPDKLFWLQFKRQFQQVELPLNLKWELTQKEYDALKFISYDFERYIPDMRDSKFSRDVSKGFYYFAQVMETESFVALIYISKEEFMMEYAPIEYYLVTYSPTGKIIDRKVIGGREFMDEEIRVASVRKDGVVDITIHSPKYEKDTEEHGFWDNRVSLGEKIGKEQFTISATGKIVKSDSKNLTATSY